jgi:cytochrome c oxidase cbb3-type subunit 1
MITFGSIYALVPWMWKQKAMYSPRWSNGISGSPAGTVIYVFAMWNSGIIQGLMWRTYNDSGTLAYSFIDSSWRCIPTTSRAPLAAFCS